MISSPKGNWVCYLLQCADDTLYCGITNDLDKRLVAHNAGTAAKYTRARGPVALVYVERCEDKSAALKRELAIKRLTRAEKLALIATVAAGRVSPCAVLARPVAMPPVGRTAPARRRSA